MKQYGTKAQNSGTGTEQVPIQISMERNGTSFEIWEKERNGTRSKKNWNGVHDWPNLFTIALTVQK